MTKMTRRESLIGICYNDLCPEYRKRVKRQNQTSTCTVGVIIFREGRGGSDCPHCKHGIFWLRLDMSRAQNKERCLAEGVYKKQNEVKNKYYKYA